MCIRDSHGAAGAVLGLIAPAAAFYVAPRATARRVITLATLGSLLLGPLVVAAPFETGGLHGLTGLLAFVLASGVAALLGVALAERGAAGGRFTVANYRDWSGMGRNLSIEILEFFDKMKLTRRMGNERELVRSAVDVFGPGAPGESGAP